jgi:predicted SprT family Zn-dependent metalloprotease
MKRERTSSPLPSSASGKLAEVVARALNRWSRVWGARGLRVTVTVAFSPRLRSSLGRAAVASGRISLHPALRTAPRQLLEEVLCHEVAHVVAYRRARAVGAPPPRPHGAEWAALVRAAGYEPQLRASKSLVEKSRPCIHAPSSRRLVVHMCPVCQVRRIARRAVPAWRCSACVAAGLEGRMEVIPMPTGIA